jgi:hypothetical protein
LLRRTKSAFAKASEDKIEKTPTIQAGVPIFVISFIILDGGDPEQTGNFI